MTPRYALLLMAAGLCRAQNACPWLNAATAGGILGGPVTASVKPTVCEFVRHLGSNESTLRIEVQKKPASLAAKCDSTGTPIKAIGNEALACTAGSFEIVIGRVRDQRFAVSIGASDPSVDRATLQEKARKVAEQLAGNLF